MTGRRAAFSGHELPAEEELTGPRFRLCKRHVRSGLVRPQEVHDFMRARREELGDQAPVTAPPGRFGAHEAGRRFGERTRERVLPFPPSHPRRVASKGRRPEAVKALLAGLARSPAAELDLVLVGDPGRRKRRSERAAVVLGVAARRGEAADVDERPDAGGVQAGQELLRRAGSVADREHAHGFAYPVSPLLRAG